MSGLYQNVLGISSKVYIESRGLINPPRLAALALSSPESTGILGALAAQGAGLLGGSAMRPGDMVFAGRGGKPISVTSQNQISPGTKYFIRETPYPPSIANRVLSGQQSLQGLATTAAVAGAKMVASSLLPGGGGFKALGSKIKDALKGKKAGMAGEGYGDTFNKKDYDGSYFTAPIKTTTHYNNGTSARSISLPIGNTTTLDGKWTSKREKLIDDIITGTAKADPGSTIVSAGSISNNQINLPYVLLQQYGLETNYILLPGTVSGISETVTPEWQGFRYVGSPFQTYRYSGVERSIKFNVKLYTEDPKSKNNVQKSLDRLRRMAFPDENIAEITYGKSASVLFGFNPNLYYLTIHGYYKKILGIVTDVSISLDDASPWPTPGETGDRVMFEPFPLTVDVSIGMKIIENFPIQSKKIKYKVGNLSNLTGKNFPGE